ncbi:MAG: cation transporter [Acidobacteria bacterium]|nr:MAG: cation transporter [Acidobacteriota bacterium]
MSWGPVAALCLVACGGSVIVLRLLMGPTMPDRVLAADTLITLITMSIALYIVFSPDAGTPFVDVMLVISILGFLGTTALARYVEQQADDSDELEETS